MRMKNSFIKIIFSCLLISKIATLQAIELSDKAQISLITGSPGNELYNQFGHSAIRIYDPLYGMDKLFNYGTFDFETPNFLLKFAQGRLKYSLSVEDYPRFVAFYAQEGRSVYEQILNLDKNQKQMLFNFLENNYKPENRLYLYDFFFDNCSSRIRDVFKNVFKDDISFEPYQDKRTFMELLEPYMKDAWVNLGIRLILGFPSHQIVKSDDYMFLPRYLQESFRQASIQKDGNETNLVMEEKTVYQAMVSEPAGYFYFHPYFVFWSLFVITMIISNLGAFWQRIARYLDFLLFFSVGLAGCLFLLMWFATDHRVMPLNPNLIWAFPLHAFFAFYLFRKKLPRFVEAHLAINFILLCFSLFAATLFYHGAVVPIILTLMVRIYKRLH